MKSGGITATKGYMYQDYIAVLRIIELFLSSNPPNYFEIESVNEIYEDINIFYKEKFVLEQIKTKKGKTWSKNELFNIFKNFTKKLNTYDSNKEIEYHFITDAYYKNDFEQIQDFNRLCRSGKKEIIENKDLVEIFDQKFSVKEINFLLFNSEFWFSYLLSDNPSAPFIRIKEKCKNVIEIFDPLLKDKSDVILYRILERVINSASMTTINRIFTFDDFCNVTELNLKPKNLSPLENKCYELIKIIKPQYIIFNKTLQSDTNGEITVPFYLNVNQKFYGIWCTDDFSLDIERKKIQMDVLSIIEKIQSIIIINGSKINKNHFTAELNDIIIEFDLEKLKSKLHMN